MDSIQLWAEQEQKDSTQFPNEPKLDRSEQWMVLSILPKHPTDAFTRTCLINAAGKSPMEIYTNKQPLDAFCHGKNPMDDSINKHPLDDSINKHPLNAPKSAQWLSFW
jgi:hypothetical protein